MNKITLEIISPRPIQLNLKSFKVKSALTVADLSGYIDKRSVNYDAANGRLSLTIKEKAIQYLEEQLK